MPAQVPQVGIPDLTRPLMALVRSKTSISRDDGGALPAGDDERVDVGQVLGQYAPPHGCCARGLQGLHVLGEVPLKGQDPNPSEPLYQPLTARISSCFIVLTSIPGMGSPRSSDALAMTSGSL